MTSATAARQDRARIVFPLLLLCLALRAIVPAGWMPMFGADGISIQICPGWDGAAGASTMHMDMAHDTASSDGRKGLGHSESDHPCAFSVVAATPPGPLIGDVSPALLAPEPAFLEHRRASHNGGLAAPPPPSTGPPLHA